MIVKSTLLALALSLAALSLQAAEIVIPLNQGKPSQQEFERAAKRALYSRNYQLWSVDPGVVIGKYKKRVEIALILLDDRIMLRVVDDGGVPSEKITSYLRNLERDFTYELVDHVLAPQTRYDPAALQALLASARGNAVVAATESYTITGRYQSRITRNPASYAFKKTAHRNVVITFTQDGNELHGVGDQANLKITATIEGDEIRFATWPSDITSNEIKGKWKIGENGQELTGKWSYHGGNGDWNLYKID